MANLPAGRAAERILSVFILALLSWHPGVLAQEVKEEIRSYTSVGRIKWRLPTKDFNYNYAVPHWTAGPRIQCRGPKPGPNRRFECELGVQARDLTFDSAKRRARLEKEMQESLKQAVEKSVDVRTHGPGDAILYVTLTDRTQPTDYKYFTQGYYATGSAVIRFTLLSNDDSGDERRRMLDTVLATESLDALGVLAWKLSDYRAICGEVFPELSKANDTAFSASPFARVDFAEAMRPLFKPDTTRESIAEMLKKSKEEFAKTFARSSPNSREFCESYPAQVAQAESSLQGAIASTVSGNPNTSLRR